MKYSLIVFATLAVSSYGFSTISLSPATNSITKRRNEFKLHLTTITQTNNGNDPLLSKSVYSTIEEGKIAVIPNFLPQNEVNLLRADAQDLWDQGRFSTDALAGYGSTGKFDPTKDRAVLRLPQWKNDSLGNYSNRQRFGSLMANVRSELAYNLNRPNLDKGLATTKYGNGSTEISYTRFGKGAFLKRHVGEFVQSFSFSPHSQFYEMSFRIFLNYYFLFLLNDWIRISFHATNDTETLQMSTMKSLKV